MANPKFEIITKNDFYRALKGGLRITLEGEYNKGDRVIVYCNENPYQYYLKLKIKSEYHGKYKVVQPVRVYPDSSKRWVIKTKMISSPEGYLAYDKDMGRLYYSLEIKDGNIMKFDNSLEAGLWTNPMTESVLYDFGKEDK